MFLLMTGKAPMVASMRISQGHRLVYKGPAYITGAGLLISSSFLHVQLVEKGRRIGCWVVTVK